MSTTKNNGVESTELLVQMWKLTTKAIALTRHRVWGHCFPNGFPPKLRQKDQLAQGSSGCVWKGLYVPCLSFVIPWKDFFDYSPETDRRVLQNTSDLCDSSSPPPPASPPISWTPPQILRHHHQTNCGNATMSPIHWSQ